MCLILSMISTCWATSRARLPGRSRWPVCYDDLWAQLSKRHGKQNGTRAMIGVLALGPEFGHDRLRVEIPTGKLIVLGDGAPYHRAKAVWSAAGSLGIHLLPLPSYSP